MRVTAGWLASLILAAAIVAPAESIAVAATPTQASTAVTPLATGPQPGTFTGRGFDTCAAPSQTTMNAWRASSPYGAVGIYISGASRSCSQPNLTASWVANQTSNGWRLIPIELGYQAPCGTRTPKMSADPTTARSQGVSAANSAANAAQALGIGTASTIYNDIEQYPSNASCRAAVLSFLSGWTEQLHVRGYLAGMYSSGSSGIKDVCDAYDNPSYTRLDQIWIAWWNGVADTDAGSYCADAYYANQQRLHQYAGEVTETWGGVTMKIDRNYLDVRVTQTRRRSSGPRPSTTAPRAGSPRALHGARRPTPANGSAPTTGLPVRCRPATSPGSGRGPSRRPEAMRSQSGTRPTRATTTRRHTLWRPPQAAGPSPSISGSTAVGGSRSACSPWLRARATRSA